MSGGSFNYLYARAEGLGAESEYRDMAAVMEHWPVARARLLELADLLKRARKIHDEMGDVMSSVEWWQSHDSGQDAVDRAVEKWRAGRPVAEDL